MILEVFSHPVTNQKNEIRKLSFSIGSRDRRYFVFQCTSQHDACFTESNPWH